MDNQLDRRFYLKASLVLGTGVALPVGVHTLIGRAGGHSTAKAGGFDGRVMGTTYSVRFGESADSSRPDRDSIKRLGNHVQAVLQNVDQHMSTWRRDSELSVFNQKPDTDWQALTPATTRVIDQALHTSSLSAGAFDVTVGPLVDLWGFGGGSAGSADGKRRKPPVRTIRKTLARVGHQAVEVDIAASMVRKHVAEANLDLSGIAKGYAVDRVAKFLDDNGIVNYLVEVGGEVRTRGRKNDDALWKVAIEKPVVGKRQGLRILHLQDQAIATSGNYRNFFSEDGQRYSHSIDPRTGYPVQNGVASVTVVAGSAVTADALSTALMIAGPDSAMDIADRHQLAMHMIFRHGRQLHEIQSRSFEFFYG